MRLRHLNDPLEIRSNDITIHSTKLYFINYIDVQLLHDVHLNLSTTPQKEAETEEGPCGVLTNGGVSGPHQAMRSRTSSAAGWVSVSSSEVGR